VDYLISSAFFRVFVSLLKDYRPYLIFPTAASPVPDPCFDLQGFLQTHPGGGKGGVSEFFEEFVKTQCWRRFCEERTFPSSGSPSSSASTAAMRTEGKRVLFFDESVLAKRNRSKFLLSRRFETPFLRDRSTDLSKTFVAPSPDTSNLPGPAGKRYVYPLWPRLDARLFAKPRIITPLLIKQQQAHAGGNMLLKSGLSFGNWLVRKPGQGQGQGSGNGGGFGGGVLSALSGFGSGAKSSSRRASLGTGHPSGGGGGGGGETTVATLWFLLFAGITGETGPAAAGQLDTAFQVLVNLRNNGLPIEEEIFPCMVFACGSCGRPDRAVDVLREMQNCGLQPSPGTFAALLQIVTMNDLKGHEALANLRAGVAGAGGGAAGRPGAGSPLTAGSIVNSVKERLNMATRPSNSAANNISSGNNTVGGAQQSSPSPPAPAPWYAAPASQGHSGSSQLDPTNPLSPLSSPQPLKIQEIAEEERITMFQLQFEMIFAGLEIDTTESCPECEKVVLDQSVFTRAHEEWHGRERANGGN
jgi:pentatricopeptide repeat protein